jgi:hypothetical protein
LCLMIKSPIDQAVERGSRAGARLNAASSSASSNSGLTPRSRGCAQKRRPLTFDGSLLFKH